MNGENSTGASGCAGAAAMRGQVANWHVLTPAVGDTLLPISVLKMISRSAFVGWPLY
jgi:hypothetical protein